MGSPGCSDRIGSMKASRRVRVEMAEKNLRIRDCPCTSISAHSRLPTMEVCIKSTRQRLVWLIVSFAVAGMVIFESGELWLARYRIDSGRLDQMEQGASLLPANGAAWDAVGRLLRSDFVNPNFPGAITDYQRALQDDPLSARYWMDLASAYEAAGEHTRAQDAFAHAKSVYPISAQVAFQYGNFLLRQQDYIGAYRELQQAVRTDPTLLPLAISRTWRSTEDVGQLLDGLLPADTEAYLQALDFLASNNRTEAALTVWERLIKLGKPFPLSRTFLFLDELIREDRSEDALHVWREAFASAGLPYQELSNHSLIWNGDFQKECANGGLDWRWNPLPGVSIDIDSQPAPNGSRALRLDFGGGSNLSLDEPFQYVPVDPNRSYRFHAYIQTEQITTESGMRFSITDPNHTGTADLLTDDFTGSRSWTAVEGDLTTSTETHFLLVRLLRNPSRLFENKLSGTAWIADVSLIPTSAMVEQGAR